MKILNKRILSLILAALITGTMLQVPVVAAELDPEGQSAEILMESPEELTLPETEAEEETESEEPAEGNEEEQQEEETDAPDEIAEPEASEPEVPATEEAAEETAAEAVEPETAAEPEAPAEEAAELETEAEFIVPDLTAEEDDELVLMETTTPASTTAAKAPELKTVKLGSIANKADGLQITWNSVPNAELYRVYRKTKGTSWSCLGDYPGTSFTDTTAVSGTLYYYTVRAVCNFNGKTIKGGYDKKGISLYRLSEPQVKSVKNITGGLTITWSTSAGATGYYVYRKIGTGKWKKIKTLAGAKTSSYTDSTASDSVTYTYCVKAYLTSGKTTYNSSHNSGVTQKRIPKVSKVTITKASKGYQVTWTAVSEATQYQLYRRTAGGSWKSLTKTNNLSYTDSSASTTVDYDYCVVAINSTGRSGFTAFASPSATYDSMTAKAQYYSSRTNWLILVNCTTNWFGIFRRSGGKWVMDKYWRCTTGASGSPTCKGVYTINYKGYSFGGSSYTCYYYSSFNGPYLIHSTKFYPGTFIDKDARLGKALSGGCIRLQIDNAKWVYDNIPIGTTVVTYN